MSHASVVEGIAFQSLLAASTNLNTGATATFNSANSITSAGYSHLFVFFRTGTIAAGGGLSVASVEFSATGTGAWGNAVNIHSTFTIGDTADDSNYGALIDLRGRNPFYRLTLTTAGAVNTAIQYAGAVLFGGPSAPISVPGINLVRA